MGKNYKIDFEMMLEIEFGVPFDIKKFELLEVIPDEELGDEVYTVRAKIKPKLGKFEKAFGIKIPEIEGTFKVSVASIEVMEVKNRCIQ